MRTYWNRKTAILGLLLAIFSDLRRRAWWLGAQKCIRGGTPSYNLAGCSSGRSIEVCPAGWMALAFRCRARASCSNAV